MRLIKGSWGNNEDKILRRRRGRARRTDMRVLRCLVKSWVKFTLKTLHRCDMTTPRPVGLFGPPGWLRRDERIKERVSERIKCYSSSHISELDQSELPEFTEALISRAGLQEQLGQTHLLAPKQRAHFGIIKLSNLTEWNTGACLLHRQTNKQKKNSRLKSSRPERRAALSVSSQPRLAFSA